MKILITGCAGFIGWNVCRLSLLQGHDVVGVDSLNDAYDVRLKQWRLAQIDPESSFKFHHLDITDRDAMSGLLGKGGFAAVINLAGRAGVRDSLADPWMYYETNLTGTLNLLECCRELNIRKFVLSSTSSVYGDGERPCREDAFTDAPLSPYAASKKAAELACYTYHRLYGIDVTVLRYFTVYGPAGRPDMSVFRFVRQIAEGEPIILYGDGSQERDFTYVEDVARGTVASLNPMEYEVINLGSDRPIVIRDLISMIESYLGKQAHVELSPRHPADVTATWADISKANTLLDWRPETSFEEGVSRAVRWYQENRDWVKEIL